MSASLISSLGLRREPAAVWTKADSVASSTSVLAASGLAVVVVLPPGFTSRGSFAIVAVVETVVDKVQIVSFVVDIRPSSDVSIIVDDADALVFVVTLSFIVILPISFRKGFLGAQASDTPIFRL